MLLIEYLSIPFFFGLIHKKPKARIVIRNLPKILYLGISQNSCENLINFIFINLLLCLSIEN